MTRSSVLREYEERVEAVLKENGGHASAFNAGGARCQGDIVIFLDADDLLAPEAAARAAVPSRRTRTSSRSNRGWRWSTPRGADRPRQAAAAHSDAQRRRPSRRASQPFDLPWVPTSANSFRLEAILRIMPIPEREYRICADRYLVHLVALLGPVVSLDEVGAYYRVHGDNAYESHNPQLNLDRLRLTIRFEQSTAAGLLRVAEEVALDHPAEILSIADLANRMISLRLAPRRAPSCRGQPPLAAGRGVESNGAADQRLAVDEGNVRRLVRRDGRRAAALRTAPRDGFPLPRAPPGTQSPARAVSARGRRRGG